MPRVCEKQRVTIQHGHTLNHDEEDIDVGGFKGEIEDAEGYENRKTGEHMVGVHLDDEFGGGHAFVSDRRLQSDRPLSFGALVDVSQAAWDRIFGRR